ncbi:hypothetical protein GA0115255_114721, partial [Streptomyces sp. Ncost-T6T-2b]
CAGTGRGASDARPADETLELQEQEAGLLLTLPQGLDWRMQPFSHAGGPRLPSAARAADAARGRLTRTPYAPPSTTTDRRRGARGSPVRRSPAQHVGTRERALESVGQ